jgi:hypothetical protein
MRIIACIFLVIIGTSLATEQYVAATTNTNTVLKNNIGANIWNSGFVNVNNLSNSNTVINKPTTIAANLSRNRIRIW